MKKLFGIWEKANVFPMEDLKMMRDTFADRTNRGTSILDNAANRSPPREYSPSVLNRGNSNLPSFLNAVPPPPQDNRAPYYNQPYQQNQLNSITPQPPPPPPYAYNVRMY